MRGIGRIYGIALAAMAFSTMSGPPGSVSVISDPYRGLKEPTGMYGNPHSGGGRCGKNRKRSGKQSPNYHRKRFKKNRAARKARQK